MWAKGLVLFLISGIDGYVRLRFHIFDDEGIELSDIVGLIGDEDSVFFEAISSFELFDKAKGNFCIGDIVRQCFLDQADTFLRLLQNE